MDCNREEALRAKEIAESKFACQDFSTAKKFALKAQQLFPALENILQMIAIIDVHIAAQVQIGADEKDWYQILQVDPSADDALIKKQYRKLALFFHPDKNKCIGAESAFKLIGEASQVLSDRTRRLIHDAKRGTSARKNANASSAGGNRYWNSQQYHHQQQPTGVRSTVAKEQQQQYQQQQYQYTFTFWTACPSCQMRYQYYRTYENQNLLCPHCKRPFIAKDLSHLQRNNTIHGWPPQSSFDSRGFSSSDRSGSTTFTFNGFASGTSRTSDMFQRHSWASNQTMPTTGMQNGTSCATNAYRETYYQDAAKIQREIALQKEELRRRREIEKELARKEKEEQKKFRVAEKLQEAAAFKASQKEKKKKAKKYESSSSSEAEEEDDNWEKVVLEQEKEGARKMYPTRRSSRSKRNVTYDIDESDDDFQGVPSSKKARVEDAGAQNEHEEEELMRIKLAKFAQNHIRRNLKLNMKLQTGKLTGAVSQERKGKKMDASTVDDTKRTSIKGQGLNNNRSLHADAVWKSDGSSCTIPKKKRQKSLNGRSPLKKKAEQPVTCAAENYSVPDADFHNFDKGREEKDIEAGQIWALYDEKNGMPRYYIRVKEIPSRFPFEVSIAWLELRKPSEEQRELLDKGFALACGEFRTHASQVMESVNSFSHLVNWQKGPKGIYKIYPGKGQVWGLYKDWEAGQRQVKVGDEPLKYVLAEVISDCSEESGVTVVLLDKVVGFRTLFQLSKEPLQVPFLELLRFSHQVPCHKLKGDEAPGVPQGCWELDPASVPLSLIFPGCEVKR